MGSLGIGIIAITVFAIFATFAGIMRRFKRCPSDRLLVVYGKTGKDKDGNARSAKVVHGGLQFVWPFIQDYAYLSLEPQTINIDLRGALSKQNIRIDVPSTFTVAISTESEVSINAAERLLQYADNPAGISELAEDILLGQLRLVIATMDIEEINNNREKFQQNITLNVEGELRKIGLKLINVNVKDITDESGYIEALGKEAAAKAVNEAKVSVSEKNKIGEIGQSENEKERRTAVAEQSSQAEIGEADAVSKMRVKTASADSRAIDGENTAQIDIANSDAKKKVAQAEASRLSVTAEKTKAAKALEDSYDAQTKAEKARALTDKATQYANEVVPAEIAKDKLVIEAEAIAEQTRKVAKGEADGIYFKMEAEAKGYKEILVKQAEGFATLVKAAGSADGAIKMMVTDKLTDLYQIQTDALSKIDVDKLIVWDNGSGGSGDGSEGGLAGMAKNFLGSMPAWQDLYNAVDGDMPKFLESAKQIASGTKEGEDSTTATEVVVEKKPRRGKQ